MQKARRSLLAGAAALLALGLTGSRAAAQTERVVRVRAKKFAFTPNEITLKRGEPVLIELTSGDVLMGFAVPDLGVRSDIVPDKITELRFTPREAGRFDFHCDIFCGDEHEDMFGKIIVV